MRIPAVTLAFLFLSLPPFAQQSQQNADQTQNSTPSQNQNQAPSTKTPTKRQTTADDNPFPEDVSKKAAAAAGNPDSDQPLPKPPAKSDNAPASPHSAPPPSDTSSSRLGLRSLDEADTPEGRISDGAGGYIFDPKLAAQDVKVGGFYYTNGEYKGAYARYKEATRVDPGNAEAVFGLAEAARALRLNSEAAENYRIYLEAVPNGSKSKAARKALAALGEAPKN